MSVLKVFIFLPFMAFSPVLIISVAADLALSTSPPGPPLTNGELLAQPIIFLLCLLRFLLKLALLKVFFFTFAVIVLCDRKLSFYKYFLLSCKQKHKAK